MDLSPAKPADRPRLVSSWDRGYWIPVLALPTSLCLVIDLDRVPKSIISNRLCAIEHTERGMHLYYLPELGGVFGESFVRTLGGDAAHYRMSVERRAFHVRLYDRSMRRPRNPPMLWRGPGSNERSIQVGAEIIRAWKWAQEPDERVRRTVR